jgi:hypothetical protein
MSQTVQRQTNPIPAWLVFSGVDIGIVGAIVKDHAESVGELIQALGSWAGTSEVATAIAHGDWGLGLLVAGAIVALAGLVAVAARRPT